MSFYDWFWSESIWVPPGRTWDDFKSKDGRIAPDPGDLWFYPFVMAAILLLLKYFILIPFLFVPIGNYYKLRSKPHQAPPYNNKLNRLHRLYKSNPPYEEVERAATDLNWTERQVQRWLRQKTVHCQATKMDKFIDCAWQVVYYIFYCILGIVVLKDKPWLYDMKYCWHKFPYHSLDNDVWWYYMISLGFYWCQTVTHFFQPKRHDSAQMLAHHLVTILVTCLSFTCNFVRIGTLVLIIHECADIPLLFAKICGYFGKPRAMDACFFVFLLVWVATRLGAYPFRVLHNTIFVAHVQENVFYPVYYVFNGLLLSIFLMHIVWTYYIIRVIARKFTTNAVQDVRSSVSEMSEADEDYPSNGATIKSKGE